MKKKLLLVLGASLLLAACNDSADKTAESTPAPAPSENVAPVESTPAITAPETAVTPEVIEQNSTEEFYKEHTAQNALDYAGVYKGQIPCADCSGIDVELTLDYNGNYDYKTTYLGTKNGDQTFDNQGRFTWNKAGQVVTLEGTSGGPDGEIRYFVGENVLRPANKNGKIINTDSPLNYSLEKVLPEE